MFVGGTSLFILYSSKDTNPYTLNIHSTVYNSVNNIRSLYSIYSVSQLLLWTVWITAYTVRMSVNAHLLRNLDCWGADGIVEDVTRKTYTVYKRPRCRYLRDPAVRIVETPL